MITPQKGTTFESSFSLYREKKYCRQPTVHSYISTVLYSNSIPSENVPLLFEYLLLIHVKFSKMITFCTRYLKMSPCLSSLWLATGSGGCFSPSHPATTPGISCYTNSKWPPVFSPPKMHQFCNTVAVTPNLSKFKAEHLTVSSVHYLVFKKCGCFL
jgi:hypothetical protein